MTTRLLFPRILAAVGLLAFVALNAPGADIPLVPSGSIWKFNATGTDLGTAWRATTYNDSSWSSGPAQLGYGDGDEKTLLPASPVRSCYYFRHTFSVLDPARFSSLNLEVLVDDGCVVYLNGQEVARYNMPSGTISYGTWASSASEFSWDPARPIGNLLVSGNNVLAVEVHQGNSTSTDVSLDLRLTGASDIRVVLDSPTHQAAQVPISATLAATATDPLGQPMTVSFYGRPTSPPGPDFTLVVVPDTQFYTDEINGGTRQMLMSQVQWIINNRAGRNIAYVAQMGDISNNGDYYLDEWQNATNAFYLLENPVTTALANGIPYGTAVGNHDQRMPTGDTAPTTFFNQYFGYQHFQGRSYYGGHYGNNNNNHYDLFSASGLDFIVIYFEYDDTMDAPVLDWADALLKAYPDRRAVLVTHYFLNLDSSFGAQGAAIYNGLKDNPNLFLLLCGHNHGEARRSDTYAGNTVNTLLADYQSYANGGNGYLRTLTFSPAQNQISVQTYSPWLNQFETDASSQFVLGYHMITGPAYELIRQQTGVASGAQATAVWSGLESGREYEWFVAASNGSETRSSEARLFTTTSCAAPASPSGLAASGGVRQVALSWQGVAGASSYSVARSTSAGGSYNYVANGLQTASYTDTGLPDAATYFYAVSAVNSCAASGLSAYVSATTAQPNRPPVAVGDAFSLEQGSTLTVASPGVLGNDSDVDGDSLTAAIQTRPTHGNLVLNGDGAFTYTPGAGFYGADGFEYKVSDGHGGVSSAAVSLAVARVNHAPVANVDSYTLDEDGILNGPLPGVLGNDTDSDGSSLTAALVSGPANGVLTLNPNGSFVYTPNPHFNGTDTFAYKANDGALDSSAATVTIAVAPANDAPVAVADAFGLEQGSTLTVASPGVLGNDSDIDGDSLTAAIQTPPTHGNLALNGDGSFTYTPDAAFYGTDSFEYSVNDGHGGVSFAAVSLAVAHVNHAPVANDDSYMLDEDGILNVPVLGVLGNDADSDGNSLTAALVSGPANGVLALNPNGSFVYTPNPNFHGPDSFVYKANDGALHSSAATVTITVTSVNDAPVAQPEAYSTLQDTVLTVTAPGVLANDADAESETLSAVLVNGPGRGSLTLNSNGSFTYTPVSSYTGTDSFSYKARDGEGGTAVAAVTLTVRARTMHVQSILVQTRDAGKAKRGYAEVVLVDANNAPVSGASVSGSFSGSITESLAAATDSAGRAVFQTKNTTTKAPKLVFTVTGATLSGWTYDPAANVETSDKNY